MYVSTWIQHHKTPQILFTIVTLVTFWFLVIPFFILRAKNPFSYKPGPCTTCPSCARSLKAYKGFSAEQIQHDAGAVMLSWGQLSQGISLTHTRARLNSCPHSWTMGLHLPSLHPRHSAGSVLLCRPQLCTTGKFSKQVRAHKPSFLPWHSTILYCSVTHSGQRNTPWLLPT